MWSHGAVKLPWAGGGGKKNRDTLGVFPSGWGMVYDVGKRQTFYDVKMAADVRCVGHSTPCRATP